MNWQIAMIILFCVIVLVCAVIVIADDDKPLPNPQPDSRKAVYNDWTVGRCGK